MADAQTKRNVDSSVSSHDLNREINVMRSRAIPLVIEIVTIYKVVEHRGMRATR